LRRIDCAPALLWVADPATLILSPQRVQTSGSTWYTLASSLAQVARQRLRGFSSCGVSTSGSCGLPVAPQEGIHPRAVEDGLPPVEIHELLQQLVDVPFDPRLRRTPRARELEEG
jgi:hypothetical protein